MSAKNVGCDTSVLVPALSPWHPDHENCFERLEEVVAVPAHALLESYSVMTRIPGTARVAPALAVEVLTDQPWEIIDLPTSEYEQLIRTMANAERAGSAIHDAQIAATAKHHGLTLLSRDHRAEKTYELIGVDYELI